MTSIQVVTVKARIENGKLQPVELPPGVLDGEIAFNVQLMVSETLNSDSEAALVEQAMRSPGMTAGEILASGLIGAGAEAMRDQLDTPEYIEQRRQERRAKREETWKPS